MKGKMCKPFNSVLPSVPWYCKWSFSLRFPHQNPVCIFFSSLCATYLACLILLDLIRYYLYLTPQMKGKMCKLNMND